MLKYGLLGDASFFDWLDVNSSAVLALDPPVIMHAIHTSCIAKTRIVEADEREAGKRALLNLGHTFAHAIENVAGYGHYLHGEAVAIGLNLATQLSVKLGQLEAADIERVKALIERYNLPTQLHNPLSITDLMAAMQKDKKNRAGKLRFVSMQTIGEAITTEEVDYALIESLWQGVGAK